MKIKKVNIMNFKNLKNLKKEINGGNILLLADNDKGKSSFIQAIRVALGSGDLPPKPISDGEQNGQIEVVTDDEGNEYTFRIVFEDGKKPFLEVTAPNGMRDHRKSTIGGLVGQIDFDLHGFVRMSESAEGRKKQVKIIRSLLSAEIQKDLTEHEDRIAEHFETRTHVNRDAKHLKGFIAESGLEPEDFKTYSKPVDADALQSAYSEVQEHNNKVTGVRERSENRQLEITRIESEIDRLKLERKQYDDLEKQSAEFLEVNKVQDLDRLSEDLSKATDHNTQHNRVKDFAGKQEQLAKLEEQSGELTALIDSSRQALADAVRNDIDMPVPDLSFNDETLLYKGQTVDVNTLSTSQIMHLGIQLKMAQHPNVKVLFIENGESFGLDKLKQIQELCKEYDYQIIMEQVERGTDELKIEIMPKY